MKNNVTEKIAGTVEKNLENLCWQCAYCPKILECEGQPATTKDSEVRYCWTIIEAAINGEIKFIQPF